MSLKLRDYQDKAKRNIMAAFERAQSVLAVLPTGGGKTVIFSSIIHDHDGPAVAVVHRKEILAQISLSLASLDVKHRIVAPPATVTTIRRKHLKKFGKSFIDPQARCGVASAQTLTSKGTAKGMTLQRWIAQVTLAVFDEGHHYVQGGQWGRAVEMMTAAKKLFVSATPDRADGKGMGAHADGYVEEMIEGPTSKWLIDQGYLANIAYKAPSTDMDLDDIPITASGEVNAKVLRARTVDSSLVGDVVAQQRQFAKGKKTIVFASDVETSEDIAAAFRAAGVKAVALSGKTESAIRDRELDNFENGDLEVLVNCELFDEGFDVPAVECAILSRVTASLSKYLQMVGRALRPVYADGFDLSTQAGRLAAQAAGPKQKAIIIDPVRNWERHGAPTWPRKWTLDSREKGGRASKADTIPQRVCLACTQPYEMFYLACPICGEPVPEPQGRATPKQVDGDLYELDLDAMNELFEAKRKVDMDREEYEADQIARRIPPIGRNKDMKNHMAAQKRRKVLHELVAWWVGAQPKGRDMREVHRRFFHRFNVDIVTAFTLSEKDTEILINEVQRKFGEDIQR